MNNTASFLTYTELLKAVVEDFKMLIATVLESKHLACFVALVTVRLFKLQRVKGKKKCDCE